MHQKSELWLQIPQSGLHIMRKCTKAFSIKLAVKPRLQPRKHAMKPNSTTTVIHSRQQTAFLLLATVKEPRCRYLSWRAAQPRPIVRPAAECSNPSVTCIQSFRKLTQHPHFSLFMWHAKNIKGTCWPLNVCFGIFRSNPQGILPYAISPKISGKAVASTLG